MVDADAELILVNGFVLGAAIVVGRTSTGWKRIPLQECARDWIHAFHRDCASGERSPRYTPASDRHRRRRVIDSRHAPTDRLREDALSLEHRRHGGDHRPSDAL